MVISFYEVYVFFIKRNSMKSKYLMYSLCLLSMFFLSQVVISMDDSMEMEEETYYPMEEVMEVDEYENEDMPQEDGDLEEMEDDLIEEYEDVD